MNRMNPERWVLPTLALHLLLGCGGEMEGSPDTAGEDPEPWPIEEPYAPVSQGGAPAADIASCQATTLSGEFNGTSIDRHYPHDAGPYVTAMSGEWHSLSTPLGVTGRATMEWEGNVGTSVPLDDSAPSSIAYATEAFLNLPVGLGFDDRYLCVTGKSSIELESNYYLRTFRGVGLLPDCASGTPVGGSVTLCVGDGCGSTLWGEVDGVSYGDLLITLSWTNNYVVTALGDVEIRVGILPASQGPASLAFSWFRDPSTGDVYCGGVTSSATITSIPMDSARPSDAKDIKVELRDLRRVGNCADVQGTDTLEVRSCIGD